MTDLIGVHKDMPAAVYHKVEAISASKLKKLVQRTPGHFKAQQEEKQEQSDAMLFGTLAHALLLSPGEMVWYEVLPENYDGRTKEGKALKASIEAQGKTPVKHELFEHVLACVAAVRKKHGAFQGQTELSLFTLEIGTKQLCKARLDYVPNDESIWDLKFTEDASVKGFEANAFKMGYHIQAAFYLDVWNALCGSTSPKTAFKFLVVEREAPYAMQTFRCSDSFIERGRVDYQKALLTYAECVKTNTWPTYPDEEQTLYLPAWVK